MWTNCLSSCWKSRCLIHTSFLFPALFENTYWTRKMETCGMSSTDLGKNVPTVLDVNSDEYKAM